MVPCNWCESGVASVAHVMVQTLVCLVSMGADRTGVRHLRIHWPELQYRKNEKLDAANCKGIDAEVAISSGPGY